MALTRELLKGMALNDEQIEAIITEHVNTKKSIEAQRDALQKQLDDIAKGKDWKAEYDKLDQSFKDYKSEIAGKEAKAAKQTAFRQLLTAENIPAKFHDRILKMEDMDKHEWDGDHFKDAKAVRKAIKDDWGEYVATPETRGVNVDTPPETTPTTLTRADIYKKDERGRYVMSTSERQKALSEHPDLMK